MAIINPITTANTFLDWLTSTQGLIEHANYYSNTTNLVFTTANNTVNVYNNTVSVYSNTVNVYNSTVNVYSNTVNVYSNTVSLLAPLNTRINSAFDHANGAFAKANSALPSAGGSISGDLTVSGNLVVIGQQVYANTEVVLIKDNILTLNAAIGQSSPPTSNSGIEIDRGSSANVYVLWNEAADLWQFTNDGTNYSSIASAERLTSSYDHANASFNFANTVNVKVDSAYAFANTVNVKTDSAYAFANTVNVKTDSAYAFANTVNVKVDAAFNTANSANASVNNLIAFPNTANLLFYVSSAPTTNKGTTGDRKGSVYLANDAFYYCTSNYDGTTNIWSKIVSTDIW